jgi:hypothetical protein
VKTPGPGLLDRVLNEIFERELKAYAQPKQIKTSPIKTQVEEQKEEKQSAAVFSEVQTKAETKFEPKAETKFEPKAETKAETKFETTAEAEPETIAESESEPKAESPEAKQWSSAKNQDNWDDAWDWADAEEGSNEDEEGDCVTQRPWLSIPEAARVLGKSPRALERCILGRWGNRLPEGWSARKVRIDGNDEWRVVPPAGYRKHSRKSAQSRVETYTSDLDTTGDTKACKSSKEQNQQERFEDDARIKEEEVESMPNKVLEDDMFGSLEKLFTSASKLAQKELASFVKGRKEKTEVFHAPVETIVIDRSDEVEKLLRELAQCQKELAAERRARLEDLKLINEMQGSMRLLEDHCRETRTLKEELVEAQVLLIEHKKQYQEFLQLPWWKRLFHKKQA